MRLLLNVTTGLTVNAVVVARHVAERLPEMVTEELLMAAVAKGGDRQAVHEKIRQHSQAAAAELKSGGKDTLVTRLQVDPTFANVDWQAILDPASHVGRGPQQVDEFIRDVIAPIRENYSTSLNQRADLSV
jgi:adenylosuccinate lyase